MLIKTPRGEKQRYFEAHVMEPSVVCRIWPYTPFDNGYPYLWVNGSDVGVHVLTAERWHGPKPSPSYEAAHSCGNRLCWAGEHLRWATASENRLDKHQHGTMPLGERHRNAKLTESSVRNIRREKGDGARTIDLARAYGVSTTTIKRIINGKAWGWLD